MNAPWRCDVVGSFAWRTCTVRWPKIVRDLASDVPDLAVALNDLAGDIVDGVVAPLQVLEPEDRDRFVDVAAIVGQRWTALPWYVGESYLYARLRAVVGWSHLRHDPFLAAKQREEATLPDDDDDMTDIATLLRRTLWGNRGDLSLPSAKAHTVEVDDDLLVDDRVQAVDLLATAKRVGIVLDNAGIELFRDLQLARLLVDNGVAVTLFAKDRPFFVSDAMPVDIARTRQLLKRDVGDIAVVADPFFTGPGFFTRNAIPNALWRTLAGFDALVFKGDANYRRLVGDRPWRATDHDRFDATVSLPAPVIAVRTLKAEVLVGADLDACVDVARHSDDWLVSGRFGVVQVARVNNVVDSEANDT